MFDRIKDKSRWIFSTLIIFLCCLLLSHPVAAQVRPSFFNLEEIHAPLDETTAASAALELPKLGLGTMSFQDISDYVATSSLELTLGDYVTSGHVSTNYVATSTYEAAIGDISAALDAILGLPGPGFVTVGGDGSVAAVAVSSDGTEASWTQYSIPGVSTLRAVTVADGLFVAITSVEGTVLTSSDGVEWANLGSSELDANRSVLCYGKGNLIAAGQGGVYSVSSDKGQTWTNYAPPIFSHDVGSIVYSPDLDIFVAVGGAGYVATSNDGITWTDHGSSMITASKLAKVVYGDGRFVAVGYSAFSPVFASSVDGVTWQDHGSGTSGIAAQLFAGAYNGSTFIGAGTGPQFVHSASGDVWADGTLTAGSLFTAPIYAATTGDGITVAVGYNGAVARSIDGINWDGYGDPGSADGIITMTCYDIAYHK